MKKPQNLITLILVLFISILMVISNKDNTRVYGEWHFDQSVGKFLQNINKEDPDYYLNNMNFNYGSYPAQNIIFFNNNSCESAEVVLDTLILGDSIRKDLSSDSEKVIKGLQKNFNFLSSEAQSLVKTIETTIVKESIKQGFGSKLSEEIKKNDEMDDPIVEEPIVEEPILEKPILETKDEIRLEPKKKDPVKPLFKDFNNSTDYQRALRKYYKEIE